MRFSAFFVLAAGLSSGFAQTVADVEAGLRNINTKVTALDNSINAFPLSGGTATQALAIDTAAQTLKGAIDATTASIKALPASSASESDGQTFLNSASAFASTNQYAVVELRDKESAIAAIPLTGLLNLFHNDIVTLNTAADNFANALIAATPSAEKAAAAALRARIDADFAPALAAYP